MSSVLTKTTISGLVTLACSGYSIQNLGCINSAIQNNKVAFFGTYGAMVAYDIYDYFKGDIQTITMKDSEGNFIEKEYRLHTTDWVKYVANVLPVMATIERLICDRDYDESLTELLIPVGITIETVADALNIHPTTTIAYEINGDHHMFMD